MQLQIRHANQQFITLEVISRDNCRWLFSAVYGSPQEHTRYEMWSTLEEFAHHNDQPWLLAGDYNDTRLMAECRNCSEDLNRRCANFHHWIENNGFIDLEFSGT